eukprot:jgi/Undpi1/5288/HiC_scaffold_2.g00569.m1
MTRTGFVHLASILHLCPFGTHAGSVSCRRICRARAVTVRMLRKCDMQNRKRGDRNPGRGSTINKGRLVNDARASHTFVPQTKAPQTWRVLDKKHTDELRQWTERNAGGAESCALGVEGGVGAGGVAATHPDKKLSIGLGEDGVGKTATKEESEAASPSAAGAGDTTAAAD